MKKIIYIALGFVLCLALVGGYVLYQNAQADPVEQDMETIKVVADMFSDELERLGVEQETINAAIAKIEELNEQTKHVVEFDVQNDTNPILCTKIHLPAEEDMYNSLEIGDVITQEQIERIEELAQFSNKIGNWTVIVTDKMIRE
jgi:hypothetical protein